MRYAIVGTEKAESYGLVAKYHRVNKSGEKMAVNENELLKVDEDPDNGAAILGGTLMELEDFMQAVARWDE